VLKRLFISLVLITVLNKSFSQDRFVYMGLLPPDFNDYNSIRFDGAGEIYPDVSIDYKAEGCYIKEWRDKNATMVQDFYSPTCALRNKIFEYYHIDGSSNLKFDSIQNIIIRKKADAINRQLELNKTDNITFIMLGYNNHYFSNPADSDNAVFKLGLQRKKIEEFLTAHGKKSLIVEVYWDGTETETPGLQTAINFHSAMENSYWAGLGLRKLIRNLNCNKVQFIAHSMGANIVAECVFNQFYKIRQRTEFAKRLNKYQEDILPPDKKMRAGLVAPAISGTTTFIDYFQEGLPHYCSFIVGYNINDSILSKKFEPVENLEPVFFITHFGSTSLGCLKSEVEATEKLFKANDETLETIDFSTDTMGIPQKRHDITAYLVSPQK